MATFLDLLLLPQRPETSPLLLPNGDYLIFDEGVVDRPTSPFPDLYGLNLNDIEVTIRDADLNPLATKIAPIKLDFRREWVTPGGWIIEIPATDPQGNPTDAAQAILTPGSGILVVSKGTKQTLLSGPAHLTNAGQQVAARRELAVVDGIPTETLEVSGIDDLGALGYHHAWPNPDGISTNLRDTRTGKASTILLEFLRWNLGDLAVTDRQVDTLVFPVDPTVGTTITAAPLYTPILTLAKDICQRGNITLDAHQTNRTIEITVAEAANRSTDVVFSLAGGTLAAALIESSLTAATHVVVAGQGTGTARQYAHVGPLPGTTPIRRIEAFLDRRDLPTLADLQHAGQVWLDENKGTVSLSFTPNSTTTGAVFGRDFNVGDLVGVDLVDLNTGTTTRRVERLIAADQKWTADGVDIELTIGSNSPFGELASVASTRNIKSDIGNLQRT